MRKKTTTLLLAGILGAALLMPGCGSSAGSQTSSESVAESAAEGSVQSQGESGTESSVSESTPESGTEENSSSAQAENSTSVSDSEAPEIAGLTFESELALEYAECFRVYYYNDGYTLIDVVGDRQYLLVPDGESVPEGISTDIILIQQPLKKIYLAATSAMSLFDAAGAMDSIAFSSIESSAWYVDNARTAMEEGRITYAGSYSKPDYELLVDEGCDLAIESTMILHNPKVQEMIEELGIPVFIDRSSYESEPLGRTEWIKVYGVMTGTLDQASEFFESRVHTLDDIVVPEGEKPDVVYFSINTSGEVIIRGKKDYISRLIELGGGNVPLGTEDSTDASETVTMEEFYDKAKDADYLIYNASIDSTVKSLSDLLSKNELLADFKAVKDGNVWSTGKSLYQATDVVTDFAVDVNHMIRGDSENEMSFLTKLK